MLPLILVLLLWPSSLKAEVTSPSSNLNTTCDDSSPSASHNNLSNETSNSGNENSFHGLLKLQLGSQTQGLISELSESKLVGIWTILVFSFEDANQPTSLTYFMQLKRIVHILVYPLLAFFHLQEMNYSIIFPSKGNIHLFLPFSFSPSFLSFLPLRFLPQIQWTQEQTAHPVQPANSLLGTQQCIWLTNHLAHKHNIS